MAEETLIQVTAKLSGLLRLLTGLFDISLKMAKSPSNQGIRGDFAENWRVG
jgi:hypothetical protein